MPQALSAGVEYDLFWRLNPILIKPFFEACSLSQKRQLDMGNTVAWLTGIYMLKAMDACFGKNKRYDDKPIDLRLYDKSDLDQTEQKAVAKKNADAIRFAEFARQFNKNFSDRKG